MGFNDGVLVYYSLAEVQLRGTDENGYPDKGDLQEDSYRILSTAFSISCRKREGYT